MASFLDKLKKGMGVATGGEEKIRKKRQAKTPVLNLPQELKIGLEPVRKIEIEGIPSSAKATAGKEEWFEEPAGQLAVDVFQTEKDLIIQTAIAGIKPGNLEITIEKDVISIKGIREKPSAESGDYFTQECYWGPFAREVIAPVEIDPDRVEAAMREGVLTIKMPKLLREKKRTIAVKI